MNSLLRLFFCLGAAPLATLGTDRAQWFEIRIADQPAGYQHVTATIADDGSILTTDETLIVLNRLGSRIEVRTRTQTYEAVNGDMISVREESSSSAQTVAMEAHRGPDAINVVTQSGENVYHRSVPDSEPIYGPAMLARETMARLRAPGDVVTCRMFLPSLGVYTLRRSLLNFETRDGQQLSRVTSVIDGLPGDAAELLHADGTPLELRRDLPFGMMVATATDEATAFRAALGGELPAEAYQQTLARANIRLPDPRNIARLRLRLTHRRPEYGWPALRGPRQQVIERTAATVVLDSGASLPVAAAGGAAATQDLGSNPILQADDAEVMRLTREVVAGEIDPDRIVRRLQEWVARQMTFDPGVAVTPASEVVRNRRGTCVAYAVLLASMSRAAGIPSRVAMGYIYVAGAWGGHAWVEAWIDGEWRPIDAAAFRAGYADAARFQFDSYDFEDGGVAANLAGLQLYSNIDVTVLEYTQGGKNHVVGADAKPYLIDGDTYDNPSLGMRIKKPSAMTFVNLDAIYPDPTVFGLQGESVVCTVALLSAGMAGDHVVQEKLAEIAAPVAAVALELDGRPATATMTPGKARLLSRRGDALWMLTVEGNDAANQLRSLVRAWTWTAPQ